MEDHTDHHPRLTTCDSPFVHTVLQNGGDGSGGQIKDQHMYQYILVVILYARGSCNKIPDNE